MTVRVRQWNKGKRMGFEVDIRFTYPDGSPYRQRIKAPVESRSAARRWGEARERELLVRPSPLLLKQQEEARKEVPTLTDFADRVVDHARAERGKPSAIDAKQTIFRLHLVPLLGDRRLDAIDGAAIAELKAALAHLAPKTVNNVLTVLGRSLRLAVEWGLLAVAPRIRLLRVAGRKAPEFYDFGDYARLVEAANKVDPRVLLVVLLGGDAGLRRGEMIGLRWADIDLARARLTVSQAVWRGEARPPKSNKPRTVPLTDALKQALRSHRHLRGERVLYADGGEPPSVQTLQSWMASAQRRAGLAKTTGGVHVLRHTFCSHLAMRGAPARAIQELAGHSDLSTTLRYMHLTPTACTSAIGLLNARPLCDFGEIVETEAAATSATR